MKRFQNCVVLVTGSDRGIGRGIAAAFAQEGAAILLTSPTPDALETAASELRQGGAAVLACPADLRDRPAIDRMIEAAVARWGRIDVLVNNAAVFPERKPFLEQTYQDWNDVLQVNVLGTFHVTQAVARVMAQGGGGRVVNISSLNSTHYRPGATGITQYGASKAALNNMTKGWALELAPHGIVVNGVAFGFVRTGMAAGDGLDTEEFKRDYIQNRRIPLARVSTPEDCAQMVLFLASPACNGMTGETIHYDGGLNFTF